MNAGELRIGNWVMWKDGGIVQIEPDDFAELVYTQSYFDFASGIPLNEEWLIRAGFVKSTNWFRSGKHAVCMEDGLYEYSNVPIRIVNHVHVLQNLIFALCGKELEFK
jgi:hypothetical protein